jgi:8-oxo-dGTP pyrophosphatase MutT (NUDIX family)
MGYISELRKLVGTTPIIMTGACVLLCDSGRLLLQRRTDNGLWGSPGGSMELGETLEDVAKRELLEETGLVARQLTLMHVFSGPELYYKYPNGDEVYNIVAAYICTDYEGDLQMDNNEVSELVFFDFTSLPLPNELSPPERPVISKFLEYLSYENNLNRN